MTTVLDQILAAEKASEDALLRAQNESAERVFAAKTRHNELLEREKQMLSEAKNHALTREREEVTKHLLSIEKDAEHAIANIRSNFAQKRELLVAMVMQALKE